METASVYYSNERDLLSEEAHGQFFEEHQDRLLAHTSTNMTDEEIQAAAIAFAKKNKNRIANELTDVTKYPPDTVPASVFMAGSPGAGKTEFSKRSIEILERNSNITHDVIRIDGDELRLFFSDYTGTNSYLFQGAISIIIDRIHDRVLEQGQTFVLDGTLFDYEKAAKNIRRSLSKGRPVFIFYVYQEPTVAWKFTVAREQAEGRNIPKSAFIDGFLGARDTVERIQEEFGTEVVIHFVKNDFERNEVSTIAELGHQGKKIDDYLPKRYTKDELETLL
jgi:glutaredoxin-related protein